MSVIVPGNFDCSKLLEVKAKVDEIWNGEGVINAEYITTVDTIQQLRSGQTARLEVLENPEKDRELKVYWPDDCDEDDPEDCGDACEMGGDPIGDRCQNYVFTECFEKKFSLTTELFRTSHLTKEEVRARALLKKMKLMDEFWNKKAIAFLNASGGVNSFAGQFAVSGSTTYIPAYAWNPDVFGYMNQVIRKNKLGAMGKMASGDLLYQYYWKVGMEQTNPNGDAEFRKMNSMGVPSFDISMDDILAEKALFLFKGSSVAFGTKARHLEYGSEGKWVDGSGGNPRTFRNTIPSNSLPGVVYDLYYSEVCLNDDIVENWKIKTRGDIFLNPLGCDNNRTGVLKFVCGEAP